MSLLRNPREPQVEGDLAAAAVLIADLLGLPHPTAAAAIHASREILFGDRDLLGVLDDQLITLEEAAGVFVNDIGAWLVWTTPGATGTGVPPDYSCVETRVRAALARLNPGGWIVSA